MLANLVSSFSGQPVAECLPKFQSLIDLESDEIDIGLLPGASEAERWLQQTFGKG